MCVMCNLSLVPLEIVLVLVQVRRWFAPNIPQAWKLFLTHTMELLGDVGHVESVFGPFGDSVTLDD
jgi:hypothetical protein